jgi:periplasmic divalent cation tolerance protein
MEKAFEYRLVFVTVPNYDRAAQIAKNLVAEKLAACCSIIDNVISIFGWMDAIQERHEYIILIKTREDKLDELENRVIELHTDEVPEIISLNLEKGFPPYLQWMKHTLDS